MSKNVYIYQKVVYNSSNENKRKQKLKGAIKI